MKSVSVLDDDHGDPKVVLHGTWMGRTEHAEDLAFFVWPEFHQWEGEFAQPLLAQVAKRVARSARSRDEESAETMGHANALLSLISSKETEAALTLPAAGTRVIPSGEVIIQTKELTLRSITLLGWRVDPSRAIEYLARQTAGRALPDVLIGESIAYWSLVTAFTRELVVQQHYLPGVSGAFTPQWQTQLIRDDDKKRYQLMMRAMPPVCRALSNADPRKLLDEAMQAVLDVSTYWYPSEHKRKMVVANSPFWMERLFCADSGQRSAPHAGESADQAVKNEIGAWHAKLRQKHSRGFRACFRLQEPDEERNPWRLEFLLQSTEDPSLLVAAPELWKNPVRVRRLFKTTSENLHDAFLEDLGRATVVMPELEQGLKVEHPERALLELPRAHAFLSETAWLLQESDFGVLLPSFWADHQGFLLSLNITPAGRAQSRGTSFAGIGDIFNYNWRIAIAGQEITQEEFMRLAACKAPLVQVRGQWVELKQDQLAIIKKLLEKQRQNPQMTMQEILQARTINEDRVAFDGIHAQGWLEEVFSRLTASKVFSEIEAPADFQGELRPYQKIGLSWLSFLREFGLGSCLADDMGLGKTIQVLALLLKEKAVSPSAPTLLICPSSLVGNWEREIAKFAPRLGVWVHHGAARKRDRAFITHAREHDLVISTYQLARRDAITLGEMSWNGIILDEAQNIKNASAKQSQAVRTLKAKFRIALTGTPVENKLADLWSIMEFLNPGYLGSFRSFEEHIALPIQREHSRKKMERLRTLTQPFMLRRLKTDPAIVSTLPQKMEIKTVCTITKEQATLYQAVLNESLKRVENAEGISRRGEILATLTKLKQVCNHPAHFLKDKSRLQERSGKLERLREMLEEVISKGEKALIFTQFTEMGNLMRRYLEDVFGEEALFLHGGIKRKERDRMVARFQAESRPRLFLLTLKAGGVGLNLTSASYVFHYDRWWNPAVENQATDRAFRIGQTQNVQVYKFISAGTLEENIDRMIEDKLKLAQEIIGTGEGWITELSTRQLKELLTLKN